MELLELDEYQKTVLQRNNIQDHLDPASPRFPGGATGFGDAVDHYTD